MRILIVEDNNSKVERVIGCLVGAEGITRDQIEVAYTVFDARRLLREESFELMIVDFLIPLRPGDEPQVESAVTLLTELRDRSILRKPQHIIGLTAYEEGVRALQPIFSQQTWAIALYSDEGGDWCDQLRAAANWITRAMAQPHGREYVNDVCIIAALQTPEYDALMRNGWDWTSAEPLDDTTFVRRGMFKSGNESYRAISAYSPKMGMIPAALLSAKLIELARPRFLTMVGICAGVKGRANYGDPIIADPCWDWQSGKHILKSGQSEFEIRPEQLPLSQAIRARWEQLKSDRKYWNELKSSWQAACPDSELRPRLGPAVSGSSVLSDANMVETIKAQHGGLVAIEMEAYGVLSAAHVASTPRPVAFSCKSVCDFADDKKDDRWQGYAAYTSAMAISEFFNRYMHEFGEAT